MTDARNRVGLAATQGITRANVYAALLAQGPLTLHELAATLSVLAEHKDRRRQLQRVLEVAEAAGWVLCHEADSEPRLWDVVAPNGRPTTVVVNEQKREHCPHCGAIG